MLRLVVWHSLGWPVHNDEAGRPGCGDGFQCSHNVVGFKVECGGAACTSVLVYMSIKLRETVSKFRSIKRFSKADIVHQVMSPGTLLI
jgi:hypothetical protein